MTGRLHDEALERIYGSSRGPVAFIDESHRAGLRPGEVGFYTTAAVIIAREQLEDVRAAMVSHSGREAWHTTEAFKAGRHAAINKLADYLTTAVEWNIVATQAPMLGHAAGDYARAREAALTTTLRAVTRGANPVQVVVLDTLGDERADGLDRRLGALLRGTGQIPDTTLLRHSDDKLEPLLGASDLVAWATRRLLAVDDRQWFDRIADVTTVLDAGTGATIHLDRLLGAAGRAAPSPSELTPAQRAAQAIAASFPTPIGQAVGGKALQALMSQAETVAAKQRAAGNVPGRKGPRPGH